VQPGDVQAFVAEEDEHGGCADGVDGHVTAAAPGHGLAQGALAGLPGQPPDADAVPATGPITRPARVATIATRLNMRMSTQLREAAAPPSAAAGREPRTTLALECWVLPLNGWSETSMRA